MLNWDGIGLIVQIAYEFAVVTQFSDKAAATEILQRHADVKSV
jgi:hypothetical protein